LRFVDKYKVQYIIIQIFCSVSNEGDIHGNGDEVADNEQRIKISNAILPYLEHLHKLLLDPPYVTAAFHIFLYKNIVNFLKYI